MIRLANPPSAFRYHCWELRDDGRRCKRCGNRSQLFGDRDVESGWVGYCLVCNMEWYTWHLDTSVRTCNRACSIHCLCGLIRLTHACCLIRDFIFQGYAAKLRWSILSQFRFKVLQVSWLACPMEGWLESDSDVSADWGVRPSLRTLRYVFVESPGFKLQCKAAFPHFCLLDAVTTYLYHPMPCPPRCLPEDCPRYAQGIGTCLGGAANILMVGIGCGTKRLRSISSSMLHLCSGSVICVPAGCTRKDHSLGGTILVPVTSSTSLRLKPPMRECFAWRS